MKKLIFVTLLAVAASWLLHEARQPSYERPESVDDVMAKRVVVIQDAPPILPPVPPLPPSPPGSIRTIPWKPAQDRPKARDRRSAVIPQSGPTASAKATPSWFPKSEAEEESPAKVDAFGSRVLLGRLSASEDRARQDLRLVVDREVSSWLAADVPPSWKVPPAVLGSMVQAFHNQAVTKSLVPANPEAGTPAKGDDPALDGLYTLYRAGQKLDFSADRRAQIVGMYRRDLAAGRMHRLGGGLALALVGLAVLSGYIKADEATKGYYTNRLRLAAAAGLGAAGVAAYRFLA
jgi:hypothetical protein